MGLHQAEIREVDVTIVVHIHAEIRRANRHLQLRIGLINIRRIDNAVAGGVTD